MKNKGIHVSTDEFSTVVVERKVRALLNKLTPTRFDTLANQLVEFANLSERERDGRTLVHIVRLIFHAATDQLQFSMLYARACRRVMECVSPKVSDENMKDALWDSVISGAQLFRHYLLTHFEHEFKRVWGVVDEDDGGGEDEVTQGLALPADHPDHLEAQKVKRYRIGLVKFLGELFKLQMLTDRIAHGCIERVLDGHSAMGIEAVCVLMTNSGKALDTAKARDDMNAHFSRIVNIIFTFGAEIGQRERFMFEDVMDLRDHEWEPVRQAERPIPIISTWRPSTFEIPVTEAGAKGQVKADADEFFSNRDVAASEVYLTSLLPEHHHLLVEKLVMMALQSGLGASINAQLVAAFFDRAARQGLCSPASFEQGFTLATDAIDSLAATLHDSLEYIRIMANGAHLQS